MTDYDDLEIWVDDSFITPPAMMPLLVFAHDHFKSMNRRINRVEFGPLAADPRRRNIQIVALRDAIRTLPRNEIHVSYSTYTCAAKRYLVYAIMQFTEIQDEIVQKHRDKWHKEEMAAVLTDTDKFQIVSSGKAAQVADADEFFEYAAVLYCIFAVPSLYARVKSEIAAQKDNRGCVSRAVVAAFKAKLPGITDCCTLFCAYFAELCGRARKGSSTAYDPSCGSFIHENRRISDEAACIVDYTAKFKRINPSLLQYVTTTTCDTCNAVTKKTITTDDGINIKENTAGQNSIDVLIRTCFAEDKTDARCDTCDTETTQTSEYHINRPPGVLLVDNTGGSTVAEFEFVNLAHGAQHAQYRACVVVCKDDDGDTSVHRRVPHTDKWELRRPGYSALVTSPNCVERHQISFLLYEQTSTVAEDNRARNMFLASDV
jgi:hypothetical protein